MWTILILCAMAIIIRHAWQKMRAAQQAIEDYEKVIDSEPD